MVSDTGGIPLKMELFKAFKKGKPFAVLLCMLTAGACYSCGGNHSETELVVELEESEDFTAKTSGEEETQPAESTISIETAGQTEEALLCVHVCGSVNEPGVYLLPAGSRVYEAVEAAGGITQDAAPDFLNLAEELADAMKVEVPSLSQVRRWEQEGVLAIKAAEALSVGSEAAPGGAQALSGSSPSGLVNINTASREELMTLKGIGESRAEDIIHYRENFGGFRVIQDIMNVPGIKEGAFEKIKDNITV